MLFLNDPIRTPLEQTVSEYIGQKWTIQEFKDLNDLSSHPSALLSNGFYSIFAKFSNAATCGVCTDISPLSRWRERHIWENYLMLYGNINSLEQRNNEHPIQKTNQPYD